MKHLGGYEQSLHVIHPKYMERKEFVKKKLNSKGNVTLTLIDNIFIGLLLLSVF